MSATARSAIFLSLPCPARHAICAFRDKICARERRKRASARCYAALCFAPRGAVSMPLPIARFVLAFGDRAFVSLLRGAAAAPAAPALLPQPQRPGACSCACVLPRAFMLICYERAPLFCRQQAMPEPAPRRLCLPALYACRDAGMFTAALRALSIAMLSRIYAVRKRRRNFPPSLSRCRARRQTPSPFAVCQTQEVW